MRGFLASSTHRKWNWHREALMGRSPQTQRSANWQTPLSSRWMPQELCKIRMAWKHLAHYENQEYKMKRWFWRNFSLKNKLTWRPLGLDEVGDSPNFHHLPVVQCPLKKWTYSLLVNFTCTMNFPYVKQMHNFLPCHGKKIIRKFLLGHFLTKLNEYGGHSAHWGRIDGYKLVTLWKERDN